jgi:hypothetical protein
MPRHVNPGIARSLPSESERDETVILYLSEADVQQISEGELPTWMIESAKRALGFLNGTHPLLHEAEVTRKL